MGFGGGKLILLGEHGVVYGRPAIAAGLERGVRTRARRAARLTLRIPSWGLEIVPDARTEEPLARALAAILELYPSPEAAELVSEIALPAGAGLGCSAALGVSVIAALDALHGIARSPEERGRASLRWEEVFHGNPSGIDNMISACGGIALFRRGEPLEAIHAALELRLVVADSGVRSSTKERVEQVARLRAREPEEVERVFEAIAALVLEGKRAIEAGQLRALGKLMDLNQALLGTLLLSTPELEEMCALARERGALGAKLTGAGGGGCMIALVADEARAAEVRDGLEELGRETFVAEIATGMRR
ncbi:MAG: mevalonate kinase [Myxococcales bacterium]|nr:mevalonate kinase [Myxococcales bacterium]